MTRALIAMTLLGILLFAGASAAAAPLDVPHSYIAAYSPTIAGQIVGYRLAGIEPDGDPLYQTALQTKMASSAGMPSLNLIVSAYLENFKPDTTPILPDLLHPKHTAQNLGGFLSGKALLTDNAGKVLYVGDFLAEAFLDNTNHTVMSLDGSGPARGSSARLKGQFALTKAGKLSGTLTGSLALPVAARAQIVRHHGATMNVKHVLDAVTVRPAPMMGTSGKQSQNTPLHTGFNGQKSGGQAAPARSSRTISGWTIAAAAGAVLSFLMAGILFWTGRKKPAAS